jgi:hypothetical protein
VRGGLIVEALPPQHSPIAIFQFLGCLLYICLGVPGGSLKNIDDITPHEVQNPFSGQKMKRICAWKLLHSSYIGGVLNDQNYLEEMVSLIKMMSFSL